MSAPYRPELPRPIPPRIARLPLDHRGYPVPFFVGYVDGKPDHRLVDPAKLEQCIRRRLCWICGERLGSFVAFPIGPMCAINRLSSEPPSHRDCAIYALQACPFITRPHMVRRESGLPEGKVEAAGIMNPRNPGVMLLWIAKQYGWFQTPQADQSGVLFQLGTPTQISIWKEGKPLAAEMGRLALSPAFESGVDILRKTAEEEGGDALQELERRTTLARRMLGIEAVGL